MPDFRRVSRDDGDGIIRRYTVAAVSEGEDDITDADYPATDPDGTPLPPTFEVDGTEHTQTGFNAALHAKANEAKDKPKPAKTPAKTEGDQK